LKDEEIGERMGVEINPDKTPGTGTKLQHVVGYSA
jgi:hypothetical protein